MVAVVNSSDDLVAILREALEEVGHTGAHEIEGRRSDLSRVVRPVLEAAKKRRR